MKTLSQLAALAIFFMAVNSSATGLVYTPINPSFGGNPLNGNFLLGVAQSQNKHKDPDLVSPYAGQTALDRFTSSLQSRLLNDMLTDLGDGGSGYLETNDFIVEVGDQDGTITIGVTDRNTGEYTEVIVSGYASGGP